ncbi:MAG: hypothetical protein LBV54_03390 [Puniceicoccales bacterium]|jgi:hypothetical protein|nr:hypothetical protein [Puniceicoccales bacterium]
MSHINRIWIATLALSVFGTPLFGQATAQREPFESSLDLLRTDATKPTAELRREFGQLPNTAKLRSYWWWTNGRVTPESITHDLTEMKAKGYGGAVLIDWREDKNVVIGPVFMSPDWMALYRHTVKEADRLGIELTVNAQSGAANPGGPAITPELAMKKLVYTETIVKGGQRVQVALRQPPVRLLYRDVLVQAIPLSKKNAPTKGAAIDYWDVKTLNKNLGGKGIYPLPQLRARFDKPSADNIRQADILDLSGKFDGKTLTWEAPAGDWLVIRYGWTCTGARTSGSHPSWSGLALDHLDPDAFELFRQATVQPLIDAAKETGNSLKFLFTDSWEMGMVNWTGRFPEVFKKFRGYGLEPWLPVLAGRVVESQEASNRFLHDFRKTIADCIIEYHYKPFADLAHKHGMGIHPESGGPHYAPIDALRTMGVSDFPQGEFWAVSSTHRVSDADRLCVRQSACVAHTNGKRFVAAEGPTSIGPHWERSPRDLKANIDRAFCSGLNRIVWHTFSSSSKEYGKPGTEYFAGTHLNPNVTWWEQAPDFIAYLNRCSYLLQQGLFVADVLCYYGDDTPNFVFLKSELSGLNFGYDWDKCSKDVILNRTSVRDGRVVLPDGMSYRLLVLAPEQAIDLGVLRKVEELVKAGATVYAPRPKNASGLSGYPQSDAEVAAIADRLWGKIDGKDVTEHRYGKGVVMWGVDVNRALAVKPDFAFDSPDAKTQLDYIHRRTDTADIYMVCNPLAYNGVDNFKYLERLALPDREARVVCKFRVTGKTPELWNPLTGEIVPAPVYREEDGQTLVPLVLPPEGSVFVVFTDRKPVGNHVVRIEKDGNPFWGHVAFRSDNRLTAAEPGEYVLHRADGSVQAVKVAVPPREVPVEGSWRVRFDPAWGGPAQAVFNELNSWTKSPDNGVKYYSGQAVYEKEFLLSEADLKDSRIVLDLGNLREMAVVTLNGHRFPLSWISPYTLDVTGHLKAGTNHLAIEITNLWANRLIGDGKLPVAKRLTKTNIGKFNARDAEKYLRVSGLLGPVKLRVFPEYQ